MLRLMPRGLGRFPIAHRLVNRLLGKGLLHFLACFLVGWTLSCGTDSPPRAPNEGSAPGAATASQQPPAQTGAALGVKVDRVLNPELERLQHGFLSAIREGDSQAFLSYVSRHGVSLGVEPADVTRREIIREITQKKGIFCMLFDSECLTSEDAQRRFKGKRIPDGFKVCSYREMLAKPDEINVSTSVDDYGGAPRAEIIVHITNYTCSDTPDMWSFIFRREKSGWKLVAFPYT